MGEQQVAVEIDVVAERGDRAPGRDPQPRLDHATEHHAETESARILSEAKERRAQMERDAEQLVQAELKATRESLIAELMENALESAEARLKKRIGESDQLGFADEYVRSLPAAAAALRGRV